MRHKKLAELRSKALIEKLPELTQDERRRELNALLEMGAAILAGVIVSLFSVWLAGRQHAKEDRLKETKRRDAILASIGQELRWNRNAARSFDARKIHCILGVLSTVAFERHGADLAEIAPKSVEIVFKHYSKVSEVREGIRVFAGMREYDLDETQRIQRSELTSLAGADVSNTATDALKNLGLPLDQ